MPKFCMGCMEQYEDGFEICPYCGYIENTKPKQALHIKPGSILHDRFIVGQALGFGGFGVTYIGWDALLEHKVAIKEYLPSEFSTRMPGVTQVTVFNGDKTDQFRDGLRQFVDEAKRLAKLNSIDGIVRIYDSFEENNTAYIIMEYLEGETLAKRLEREKVIDPDDAIAMLLPVIDSMEQVHKQGIIHRDLAPDNLFITKDGTVKVIDFGAARFATTSHSRSLTVIIKPGYSAEEQYRSRADQGSYTDVYSIGATLYKMITGITPPDALERRAMAESSQKDMLDSISKHNKNIRKNTENAILNAMNISMNDRTPTMKELAKQLRSKDPVVRVVGRIKRIDLYKWPLWTKITAAVAMLAILVFGVLFGTGVIGFESNLQTSIMLAENEARVPSVVNCSVDVAQNQLIALGLECKIVGTEYYEDAVANTVFYQSISAGRVVDKSTVVELYITTNEGGTVVEENIMPNVIYKTESEVIELLEAMGLNVKIEYVYDDIAAEGLVIAQSLDANSEFAPGDQVTVTVSQGVDPDKEEATVTQVVLARNTYSLYVNDSVNLYAEGGTGSFSYASSNENVVKVSRKGIATAISAGTATITVSSGDAKPATCTITVKDYNMSMSRSSLTVFVDASATLSVSGIPSNAEVTWSSSDKSVATVNSNGKVTGKSTGTATITATWKNGKKTYTASAKVTVEGGGITLSVYKISAFYVGDTRTIVANSSSGSKVTWSSSDTAVATVNDSGVVTAVGAGSATITAKCGNYSESCSVTVTQPSLRLTKSTVSVYIGGTSNLPASVTPTGTPLVWKTENSSIATVNDGKITGVGTGTTKIWVEMTYGGKTYEDSCEVTVAKPTIKISSKSLSMYPTESKTLTAIAEPGDGEISWSSSNQNIATVSNGKVTGVGPGTVKITAKLTYGGKSYEDSCEVTISTPTVQVSSKSLSMYPTESKTLTATTKPGSGEISWSSSNQNVATVNDGKVTGVGPGTARITVKYTCAGKSYEDSCDVTISKPTVQVSSRSLSLAPTESKTLTASTKPGSGNITWSSSNQNVATVNGGKVTGVAPGSARITVMYTCAGQTYEDSCEVTVSKPTIKLSATELSLMPGDSETLRATVSPNSFTVSWSSSNQSIVTVNNGTVKAVDYGTATVSATITCGGQEYSAKCTVTVEKPTITVTSSAKTITYAERDQDRETCTLTANVNPDGGKVTWESSNSSVAKVSGKDKQATVTAVSNGTATITATYSINGTTVKDSCEITVKQASSTLKITNVSYPKRGSVNDFYFNCDVSSNYRLVKLSGTGTAVSNALGIPVSNTPNPHYFEDGVYATGKAESNELTQYFLKQYRALYELYVAAANILGADDSLTITITATFEDSYGATATITLEYILDET